MIMVLIIALMGFLAVRSIPKESSPTVALGIVSVNTIYLWASAQDVDELVTKVIEKELLDLDAVKEVSSTSRANVSSVIVTLKDDYDIDKGLTEIKNEVDKIRLPSQAEDPNVIDIATETDRMFDLLLYGDTLTTHDLYRIAHRIKADLEGKWSISKVEINGKELYDIRIEIDKEKADSYGIDITTVSQTINTYVSSTPLGSFVIDGKNYDFTISKTASTEQELLSLNVPSSTGLQPLSNIATIYRDYEEKTINNIWSFEQSSKPYVSLTVSKSSASNSIKDASDQAKILIDAYMPQFASEWVQYTYGFDIGEGIQRSYDTVFNSALSTLILVFLSVLLFISFKESVISVLSLPLAFGITFIVFSIMGTTLNFMVNFSMIVTFGIAIDTIIVILEWAAEKKKLWFSPFSAALLALQEYKTPLIASTATTCVVFIPLFTLPGTLGKFLAFIPITIFITLIAALFISLTVNPALFYLFNRQQKFFTTNEEENYFTDKEKELLRLERQQLLDRYQDGISVDEYLAKQSENITARDSEQWWRYRLFHKMMHGYEGFLKRILSGRRWKQRLLFLLPVVAFILSNALPIKTIQFPQGDADTINVSIQATDGTDYRIFEPYLERIDTIFTTIAEQKQYWYSAQWNTLSITLELIPSKERQKNDMQNSFEISDYLRSELQFLESDGLAVNLSAQSWGPPGGKAVGVTLRADSKDQLQALQEVAADFETFMKQQPELIEITNDAQSAPGQFAFAYDLSTLQQLWLTPWQLNGQIIAALNARKAATVTSRQGDHDIVVRYDQFANDVSPQDILAIKVNTPGGSLRLSDVMDYRIENTVTSIKRKDGTIIAEISADLIEWVVANDIEPRIEAFAKTYKYPLWVSSDLAGENEANADVNNALLFGGILSIGMIFIILVLQFDSYRMPLFIIYTILMALMGANIGLFVTGNPRSLAFNIWFISLMGIVVNDAIVFIDRINVNIRRGMDKKQAIIEAGVSRLQPILLTTISTIIWLSSLVTEDEFFEWLSYTIMFGLFVGSLMTLIVIPAMYRLFVGEKKIIVMRST